MGSPAVLFVLRIIGRNQKGDAQTNRLRVTAYFEED
jgi:hypothetical protein